MTGPLPLFEQLYTADKIALVTLRSCVYELTLDKATGEAHPLYKQVNNPVLVAGYHLYRRPQTTFNAIREEVSKLFTEAHEPLREFCFYPLLTNQAVKNPDSVDENDTCNYTVLYGYFLEERKHDPNKPVVVENNQEAIEKAVTDALTPYYVLVPFVMAIPEDPRFMFNLSFDHTPDGAVSEYDSSKHEVAPTDDTVIQSNGAGTFISPEDIELHRKIRACMEKQASVAEFMSADGKLPEDFRVNEEQIAKEVGLADGHAVAEFLKKFQANMSELNPEMPEIPEKPQSEA